MSDSARGERSDAPDPESAARTSGNVEAPPGRLRWRVRRGQRELDIVLTRWLDDRYAQASPDERNAFAALLDCSDPDILDWVLGRAAPPAELNHVVSTLAARDRSCH
ncbi:MAG: succinate dehydrogenase assembly factor 2 [Gammaproteobacteria bacterium]